MSNSYDILNSQLRGYLREFFIKPDLSNALWSVGKDCMSNEKSSFYAVRFLDDLSMKQFVQSLLLSSGKQFNWLSVKSFSVVQDNLSGQMLLPEYVNFDLVFVIHDRGTMYNKIAGQTINQLAVLRAPKKTFFFDRGGYPLGDLMVPVVSVSDLMSGSRKSGVGVGDDL